MARLNKAQREAQVLAQFAGQVIGLQAFKDGKPSIPYCDIMIKNAIGEGVHNALDLLKGWVKGWTQGHNESTTFDFSK